MPPSSGQRAARSLTARPWGMKKRRAASTHSVSELGPAAAAVANQRRLNTATMLNSTMSRSPRARGSAGRAGSAAGAVEVAPLMESALEVDTAWVEHFAQQSELLRGRRLDAR